MIAILVTCACASTTTSKVPGRYGVVLDPALVETADERTAIPSVGDSILRALRDRLETVETTRSTSAAGYDAIIVLQYGGGNLFKPSNPDATVSAFTLLEYEILRGGASIANGSVPLRGLRREEGARAARARTQSEAYAQGIEVARVVAQALK